MHMLEVKDLHVSYGAIKAVKGIDFHVDQGEIVTLIGSNGAGKTTILRTISGLERAHRGEILFKGENICRTPSHEIVGKGITHVPEGRRIFTNLSVMDNLKMAASLRKDKESIKRDFDAVFDRFPRLKERCGQSGLTLSGGEQQMLAIGRALMSNPRFLMLDEPSMGLAPLVVEQVFEIIAKIRREMGTTILLVEQNANMALGVCDRAYLLSTGEITDTGTREALMANERLIEAYLGAKKHAG